MNPVSDREYLTGLMKRLRVQADAAKTCAVRSAIGSAEFNKGRGAAFDSIALDIQRFLERPNDDATAAPTPSAA